MYKQTPNGQQRSFDTSNLNFNPEKEILDLRGKVILITGGIAGLGHKTAISLAVHDPGQIFSTGRSPKSANQLLYEVRNNHPKTKVTFMSCDQTSLASVQEASRSKTSQTTRLDVIIANAVIMATPPVTTKDGYEVQFGTNHIAHALLVKLLLLLLIGTQHSQNPDERVAWLTSLGYGFHSHGGVQFDKFRSDQKNLLANLLYARDVAKHHPNIISVGIHPGTAATGLKIHLPLAQRLLIYAMTVGLLIPPEQCAWNQPWAATGPEEKLENGKFYEPVGEDGRMRFKAGDDRLVAELWERTEKESEGWTVN